MIPPRVTPACSVEAADDWDADGNRSSKTSFTTSDGRSCNLESISSLRNAARRSTADSAIYETACYGCSTWSREADTEEPPLPATSAFRPAPISAPSSRITLRCIATSSPAPAEAAGPPIDVLPYVTLLVHPGRSAHSQSAGGVSCCLYDGDVDRAGNELQQDNDNHNNEAAADDDDYHQDGADGGGDVSGCGHDAGSDEEHLQVCIQYCRNTVGDPPPGRDPAGTGSFSPLTAEGALTTQPAYLDSGENVADGDDDAVIATPALTAAVSAAPTSRASAAGHPELADVYEAISDGVGADDAGYDRYLYGSLLTRLASASPRLRSLPPSAWLDLSAVSAAVLADLNLTAAAGTTASFGTFATAAASEGGSGVESYGGDETPRAYTSKVIAGASTTAANARTCQPSPPTTPTQSPPRPPPPSSDPARLPPASPMLSQQQPHQPLQLLQPEQQQHLSVETLSHQVQSLQELVAGLVVVLQRTRGRSPSSSASSPTAAAAAATTATAASENSTPPDSSLPRRRPNQRRRLAGPWLSTSRLKMLLEVKPAAPPPLPPRVVPSTMTGAGDVPAAGSPLVGCHSVSKTTIAVLEAEAAWPPLSPLSIPHLPASSSPLVAPDTAVKRGPMLADLTAGAEVRAATSSSHLFGFPTTASFAPKAGAPASEAAAEGAAAPIAATAAATATADAEVMAAHAHAPGSPDTVVRGVPAVGRPARRARIFATPPPQPPARWSLPGPGELVGAASQPPFSPAAVTASTTAWGAMQEGPTEVGSDDGVGAPFAIPRSPSFSASLSPSRRWVQTPSCGPEVAGLDGLVGGVSEDCRPPPPPPSPDLQVLAYTAAKASAPRSADEASLPISAAAALPRRPLDVKQGQCHTLEQQAHQHQQHQQQQHEKQREPEPEQQQPRPAAQRHLHYCPGLFQEGNQSTLKRVPQQQHQQHHQHDRGLGKLLKAHRPVQVAAPFTAPSKILRVSQTGLAASRKRGGREMGAETREGAGSWGAGGGGGAAAATASPLQRSLEGPQVAVPGAGRRVVFGDDPAFHAARKVYLRSWRASLQESDESRLVRRLLAPDIAADPFATAWHAASPATAVATWAAAATAAAAVAVAAAATSPASSPTAAAAAAGTPRSSLAGFWGDAEGEGGGVGVGVGGRPDAVGGVGGVGWCAPRRRALYQEQMVDSAVEALGIVFSSQGAPLCLIKIAPYTYGLDSRRLRLKMLPDGRLAVRRGSGWEELTLALAKLPLPRGSTGRGVPP